ncbi:hypothetical protein ACIBCN_16245 [Nocardia sp. NPDC051052]|uniref:hypothetical protein n=1 Tax=Nocardia sp. NPDC051052 TaxID=3364322 RepID=UPI0037AC6CB4
MDRPFLWFGLDGVLSSPLVEPNPVMVNTLRYLRDFAGFGVGILAGDHCEWGPARKRIVADLGEVTVIVDSGTADARASRWDIFRIAEKLAGIPPKVSILIDRDAETCAAANAFGWRSIRFQDNARACRQLHCATGTQSIL